jgi:hypothetical protein
MNITERDIKVAIIAAIGAFVLSVVMLDMKGYIVHTDKEDQMVIETFKLMKIGVEGSTQISSKSSNKEAFCADGYLLVRPQKNKSGESVAGILVNDKNRPVPCSTELSAPGK